jgi:hypothetical protein
MPVSSKIGAVLVDDDVLIRFLWQWIQVRRNRNELVAPTSRNTRF